MPAAVRHSRPAVFGDRPVRISSTAAFVSDVRDQFLRADPCYRVQCIGVPDQERRPDKPSCASAAPSARPIPDAPPVTSATDPFRVIKAPFVIHYNYSKTGMSTCLGRLMGSGIQPAPVISEPL